MDFVTSDPEHPYYAESVGLEEPSELRELRAQCASWRARALNAEAKVARIEEQIDLLGMDRENWVQADRLRDVLEGW